MTQIDGLPFTQLTNLNITGELYEHGEPFGGVAAPLTLSTANDPAERPLKLRGGADEGAENYDFVNSGLLFTDGSDNEIWRLWATNPDPVGNPPNAGNLFLGFHAGEDQPTGTANPSAGKHNTGMGYDALHQLTEGSDNTAYGHSAMESNLLGFGNTALGSSALSAWAGPAGTGNNTGVGYNALLLNVTGVRNTSVGSHSLDTATGDDNTALGHHAGHSISTGIQNAIVGESALELGTAMSNNSVLGQAALSAMTSGGQNTAVGRAAMFSLTNGSNNIGIGHSIAGNLTSGSNNTFIGHNVEPSSATISNELNLCGIIRADLSASEIFLVGIPTVGTGPSGSLRNDSGVISVVP